MVRIISTLLVGSALVILSSGVNAAERPALSMKSVQEVQQVLADGGFYKAGIDGLWGPATTQSLQSFQSANGLEATGILDERTRQELGVNKIAFKKVVPAEELARKTAEIESSEPSFLSRIMPASGDSTMTTKSKAVMYYDPSEVQAAQQVLRDAGYYREANVDGIIGIHTINALKRFQYDNGLPVTGKLDEATRTELGLIEHETDILSRAAIM